MAVEPLGKFVRLVFYKRHARAPLPQVDAHGSLCAILPTNRPGVAVAVADLTAPRFLLKLFKTYLIRETPFRTRACRLGRSMSWTHYWSAAAVCRTPTTHCETSAGSRCVYMCGWLAGCREEIFEAEGFTSPRARAFLHRCAIYCSLSNSAYFADLSEKLIFRETYFVCVCGLFLRFALDAAISAVYMHDACMYSYFR